MYIKIRLTDFTFKFNCVAIIATEVAALTVLGYKIYEEFRISPNRQPPRRTLLA